MSRQSRGFSGGLAGDRQQKSTSEQKSSHSDLRVISGRYRGQKLQSPQNSATHPMGAREKLALFNMVNVEAERVLDAYAGTGALGIEALSRGASEAVFVEANRAVGRVLQGNLQRLGLDTRIDSDNTKNADFVESQPRAQILIEKVGKFALDEKWQGYFGVILADPPYEAFARGNAQTESVQSTRAKASMDVDLQAELQQLAALLQSDGVLALSSPANLGEIELKGLRVSSAHTYARARITLYRKV